MKLPKRFLMIVVGGMLLGLLILELPHTGSYRQTNLVEKMSLAELAHDATMIVTGTVTKHLKTIRQADATGEDMVYTRWQIQPDRGLKGSINRSLIIRTLGGRYLTTWIEVEDQPSFEVGEKVLVYLQPFPDGEGDYRVLGEFQGKFRLEQGGTAATAVQAETKQEFPLSELEQSIQTK